MSQNAQMTKLVYIMMEAKDSSKTDRTLATDMFIARTSLNPAPSSQS